ncbi:IS200/IS605 family accessory protein TnpB-related protein [Mesorhizobium sp. SP-1A]|uniref:IS200/IS605 family accessory protein TnpB-related protein n=1 Tax=Mesorhizobium sp. SP-1A TaxID=3077840 RepID=UPI0028F72246|nr:IS200/IS605 family accessory protein TnpB-related protein [Mesorhizobium sp. SP-1A]
MIRTFETRLDLRAEELRPLANLLDQYSSVMNHAQRVIHAKLKAGREWKGDLHTNLYKELGIGSTHLNMAHNQLKAKLSSIKELAKDRIETLKAKIKSKEGDIKKREKKLGTINNEVRKLEQDMSVWQERCVRFKSASDSGHASAYARLKRSIREYYVAVEKLRKLKLQIDVTDKALHQNKRRLGNLRDKLDVEQVKFSNPSICFGTKKLFKAQYHLEENGFKDHKEWLKAWREARNRHFKFDGNAAAPNGNDFARLSVRDDGFFDIELRLPDRLKHMAQERARHQAHQIYIVRFKSLSFNHGSEVIREALANKQPVTVSFLKDETSWKVSVTVDQKLYWIEPNYSVGALGVDFNANHVALAHIDRFGNPVRTWTLPLNTYGLSTGEAKDLIRKCAKQIVDLARSYNVPIISEKLDFARKKRDLKAEDGAKYARMLSSLSYNSFDAALASACARNRVAHRRVNPAYTSLIGRVKFARRYGLSVHTAAAVSIARRAMELSEGLPRNVDGSVTVPLNNSEHVTLAPPVRKKLRHVWSEWSGVNKELKKAHEEQRLSGRVKRPRPYTRHWRECGGTGHLRHGLSGLIGRAEKVQLSRNGQGLAKRQEVTPVMKNSSFEVGTQFQPQMTDSPSLLRTYALNSLSLIRWLHVTTAV